jgi:Rrf2 family iron-sulfur cluster assembly transcriptional regulator
MSIIKRETDYALRALARLALAGEFMAAGVLAEAEDIPEDFLRKIMQRLHRAGIVESRQGPFGGYRLALEPARVTLLAVLEAVQGRPDLNECFQSPGACERSPRCPVHAQLAQLQADFDERMRRVTLAQMIQGVPAEEKAVR